MLTDIVIPNKNEEDFIDLAKRLGYERLIFAYDKECFDNNKFENSDIIVKKAIILNSNNLNKIKNRLNYTLVNPQEKIRNIVERNKNLILFDIEKGGNDFIHQRNSGLDHIIAKICQERKHKVLFCFNDLKDIQIGRMKQNIKLARKFKFGTIIASLAGEPLQMSAPGDLVSLFKVLGMTGKEAKDSVDY